MTIDRPTCSVRLMLQFFAVSGASMMATGSLAQTITVETQTVTHPRPPLVGGTNIQSHAGNNFVTGLSGINFINDARAAKIPMIRMNAYPDNDNASLTQKFFDDKFDAIIRAGARPLLIQYINPFLKTQGRYLKADGTSGGTLGTNIAYLTGKYTNPSRRCGYDSTRYCFVDKLYVEIGNEPDLTVDYRVGSAQEYSNLFNEAHREISEIGTPAGALRNKVVLLGPAIAFGYRQQYFSIDSAPGDPPNDYTLRNQIMEYFLTNSRNAVDIVTYHSYSDEGSSSALYDVLNQPRQLDTKERHDRPVNFTSSGGIPTVSPSDANNADSFRGVAAILKLMSRNIYARNGNRNYVPIGVTEHNAGGADRNGVPNPIKHTIQQGLWNLAATAFHIRSPYSALTTSFVFDDPGNNENFGHYRPDLSKNYVYWALWMRNNATGANVLKVSGTNIPAAYGAPSLVVTATKTGTTVYLEVINRSAAAISATINLSGATIGQPSTVYRLDGSSSQVRTAQENVVQGYRPTFPAYSATIYRIPIS